jgi:hypothetical protein
LLTNFVGVLSLKPFREPSLSLVKERQMQLQALFLPAPVGVHLIVLNAQQTLVAPLANASVDVAMTWITLAILPAKIVPIPIMTINILMTFSLLILMTLSLLLPLLMTRSSSSSSTEDEKETGSTSCEFGRVACYLLGTGRGSGHKIVR